MYNDNMSYIGSIVASGISSTEPFEGKGGGTCMSKILIIEDDLSIGEMMSIYLYEEGYRSYACGERPSRRNVIPRFRT